ncbi:hypothetical protein Q8F55_000170 [Vanrija albida]|uniref:Phosphatase activator n=1 Tax=Vanrija albida TaxID=181172 RepID=A0ABR3QCH8_9TREE
MSDSNPITSVAPSTNPITSVSASYPQGGQMYTNQALLSQLNLDLRGRLFLVERETLMLLPESVLLALFPQGLILSKPASWEGGDDGVFTVDFDPDCFAYILDFWADAQSAFYGTPTTPGLFHAQQAMPPSPTDPNSDINQNPLLTKQAIIVLREELEYFSITTPGALARVDEQGLANDELRALKRAAGEALASKRQIFTALQRNVNKENNMAEQHLIDMLCMSGFNRDDEWGFRACEPTRNVISSMALVLLKTGIIHPGTPGAPADITTPIIDDKQMGTAQKLLLFWRKPARKCWWDGVEVEVPKSSTSKETMPVKVWARRVWTLELSLI